MSDLAQRLREEQILERYDNGYLSQSWNRDGKEAADRIEALEAALRAVDEITLDQAPKEVQIHAIKSIARAALSGR